MKKQSLRLYLLAGLLLVLSIFFFTDASSSSYSNSLVRYVFKIKNKIPKSRYTAPSTGQVEMLKDAAHLLRFSQFAAATRNAAAVGYTVRAFTHTNGSVYYILESTDPKRRPWGTYIFYLASDLTNFVIEVPHPVEEKNTSVIGIKSFIDSKSNVFLMSGSRKGVAPGSDVTLNADSVFEAIHEEVTTTETPPVTLQIHGFNKHKYPEIVLTSGTPVVISAMNGLADDLLLEGFTLGIYDGNMYDFCGATQNVQAQYTNLKGESFIGIFLNEIVHNSTKNSAKVIESIVEYTKGETTT